MKYEIGQQVWRSTFDSRAVFITCPDCAGSGHIRVLRPDDTLMHVECVGCQSGFHPPSGRVQVHERAPRAHLETISGVEVRDGKTEWATSGTYRASEDDLFDNEADCLAAAGVMAAEYDRAELQRALEKEKPTRSWAWNAHYHRKCLKEAERQIAHHSAKLAVAKVKAKEPEPTTTQQT